MMANVETSIFYLVPLLRRQRLDWIYPGRLMAW
jgi:hypothetical protein